MSSAARRALLGDRTALHSSDRAPWPNERPLSEREGQLLRLLYLDDTPLVDVFCEELSSRAMYPFGDGTWCEEDIDGLRYMIDERFGVDRRDMWHFVKARFVALYPWCQVERPRDIPVVDYDPSNAWFLDLWLVLAFNPYENVPPFHTLMPYMRGTDERSVRGITAFSNCLARLQTECYRHYHTRRIYVRRALRGFMKGVAWCGRLCKKDRPTKYAPGREGAKEAKKRYSRIARERPKLAGRTRRARVSKAYADTLGTTKYHHDALLRHFIALGESSVAEERREKLWEMVVPHKARAALFSRTMKQSVLTDHFAATRRRHAVPRRRATSDPIPLRQTFLGEREGAMVVDVDKDDDRSWFERVRPALDVSVDDLHIDELSLEDDWALNNNDNDSVMFPTMYRCVSG